MLELRGGHNDVGVADEAVARALAQIWPGPG